MFRKLTLILATLTAVAIAPLRTPTADAETIELLNVSYDPTRELYRAINEGFIAQYKQQTGNDVTISQSHGGSSTQARAVVDGLEADVVTLAMFSDTDAIRKAGLIATTWRTRLPNDSLPYVSTIVFVVRKGNPKGIKDWPDIVKPGVEIVTPNPKTSGNGQLSLLAAWGSVILRGGSEQEARDFITKLYKQAPVLDSGARAATTTFVQKKIGDVHLAWENEAHLEVAEAGKDQLEIVIPSISILAEPRVAVVDANVQRKGTRATAEAYLNYLYSEEGQEIIAKNFYRPTNPAVLQKHSSVFPEVKLFKITEIVKSWDEARTKFTGDGSLFDSIYKPK